ncbi:hypothetical protein [Alysiella filiformis]|uniref:Uncharacterized protein n=1 Tax=Alysiella filiformis DSM 16848 TaxID=1120981 RepID=A0A286E1P4_9NEIS|nr:hypothetical protein [Alysiella filiformis]QMT30772.1 hypothetical protein H3L97_08475 [Alysiella filiformis]UBQ56247.1 hypothetical protein JF568_00210 [Alysiella filiformis DSM 16848]SOD64811.1 hypothetical protein SAMN02746062_00046 [Alysiella filiformis DSM 16848]
MNQTDKSTSSMIFTLEDDNASAPVYDSKSNSWEQTLNEMRNSRNRQASSPAHELSDFIASGKSNRAEIPRLSAQKNPYAEELNAFADLRMNKKHHLPPPTPFEKDTDGESAEKAGDWSRLIDLPKPKHTSTAPITPTKSFGDEELDYAYREYLKKREQDHNAHIQAAPDDDIGVLIQEDWLTAQQALQSERNRKHQMPIRTEKLNENAPSTDEIIGEVDDNGEFVVQEQRSVPNVPEITVHVYDLPQLPSTRKIKVFSEKELLAEIQARLRPHLTNAVSGMVRQVLQKKMAMLSYDLQTMLNEETPQMVEDVLEHNLTHIMREIKNKLS